jgi:aspartate-semialdehyde dehydrogenase
MAVVGTDSLRGQEIRNILSDKKLPAFDVEFFDPDVKEEYSRLTQFKKEPMVVHGLTVNALDGKDIVFLATDPETTGALRDQALEGRFRAIDLHDTFSERTDVPLVVSGVNDGSIRKNPPAFLATPHPASVILSHFFHLLLPAFGLTKAVSFILQPVSAFDDAGIQELASQSVALLSSAVPKKKVFGEQIAFNILSHTGKTDAEGFCSPEKLIVGEVRRVLRKPDLPLSVSVVQAPVFHTYSLMTYCELDREASLEAVEAVFEASPVFNVAPYRDACTASALTVSGKDEIFVGRVMRERENPRAVWIWLIADNLTRGSALNAFALARTILEGRRP